jgi:hypothetical protein
MTDPTRPQVDTLLKSDEATLVLEAIGGNKVRVNCQSWEDARVILADEALQVGGASAGADASLAQGPRRDQRGSHRAATRP